jgi:hypothetical protein
MRILMHLERIGLYSLIALILQNKDMQSKQELPKTNQSLQRTG